MRDSIFHWISHTPLLARIFFLAYTEPKYDSCNLPTLCLLALVVSHGATQNKHNSSSSRLKKSLWKSAFYLSCFISSRLKILYIQSFPIWNSFHCLSNPGYGHIYYLFVKQNWLFYSRWNQITNSWYFLNVTKCQIKPYIKPYIY